MPILKRAVFQFSAPAPLLTALPAPVELTRRGRIILWLGASMTNVDRERVSRLATLADSTYDLSYALALALACSPPWELSPDEMDALTTLSHNILNNIAEIRESLAQGQPSD